jgi:hypothetical protein
MVLIWKVLEVISNGNLTEELGGLVGLMIIIVFTIIYVILFVFCDYDWVDIFEGKYESWLKLKL